MKDPGGSMSYVVGLPNYSNRPITNTVGVRVQKGALDLQPQVIKFISCWPMVGVSLRASSTAKACRHDIAEILLKVALPPPIQKK